MTLIIFSGFLTGSIRVIVCLYLISRLLTAERPDKRMISIGLAGVFVITGLLFLTDLPDVCQMALEAVWIAVCAGRLRRADTRMELFVSIFYEMAVSFWQFLLMAGMGVLFRSPAFLDDRTWNGQAAVWLLHILLIVLAVFISGQNACRFLSAIAMTGFIAVITLSEQTILVLPDDTLTMWTILAVVLLMSVLVFRMNRQYEVEKELAKLKSEQAGLLERDYTALNKAYAANAKLFHDFHNHIGVLRQLLSHEKYAEAIRYLDGLQSPVREMTDAVWTGDETADYLINSKAAAAAASGIQLQAQVEFPRHTNIRSVDLCAILGNLLDNALESAGQAPEQRFVRLTIRRINQMLVIKVENSIAAAPVEEGGQLKTTKTESGLHGWGLKSARAAAEKYDGMIQTTYTDSMFRAVATLSYQGVSVE